MVSAFFRWELLIILLISLFPALKAQEYKHEIGGITGGTFYIGDANKGVLFKGLNPSIGAVFRYNTNFRWAIKTNLLWTKVSGNTKGVDNAFPFSEEISFSRNLVELGGQAEFNFFSYSDKFAYVDTRCFTPYLLVGLGMTVASGGNDTFAGVNVPLGVGLKYKIKNRMNLGCEFSFRKLFKDNLEGDTQLDSPYDIDSNIWKNKDWYTCLLFTITWDFGLRDRPCNNMNSISYQR